MKGTRAPGWGVLTMCRATPEPYVVINDLGPEGDRQRETVMYMHPKTYLWLQEQDREREFQQRALQRAAQSGGEQRPGLVRGGIASIVKFVRQATGGPANADPTSQLTGASNA